MAHCFTLQSFAWSTALLKSEIKLELLSNPDMYIFQGGDKRRY